MRVLFALALFVMVNIHTACNQNTDSNQNGIKKSDPQQEMNSEQLIGDISDESGYHASCTRKVLNGTVTYIITFRDAEYKTQDYQRQFYFGETGGQLEKLFNFIETNIQQNENKTVSIALAGGTLGFEFTGNTASMLLNEKGVNSHSKPFTLEEYRRLFGK